MRTPKLVCALAGLVPARQRLKQALSDPQRAQLALLASCVERHQATAYGQAHGLTKVRDLESFQRQIPVVDYAALAPWVDRIAAGEANVLSHAPVLMLERSGGSTAAGKLIPYTEPFMREYSAALEPWLLNMYAHRPGLLRKSSYWSLSPAVGVAQRTRGGVPIGFESDADYLRPPVRRALAATFAVPLSVARADDADAWRYATALHLLRASDLGLISVWSPSFLTVLMQFIEENLPALLAALPTARRRALEAALGRAGTFSGAALWPQLELISCWKDGPAALALAHLQAFFPGVDLEGKGLMATEGVVTLPRTRYGKGQSTPVAASAHFYEFIDVQAPHLPPKPLWALQQGGTYAPLLTTAAGLLRYHLKDLVVCTGFFAATPILRFVGKQDAVTDLCGEKVNAAQAQEAVRGLPMRCTFAMLAPCAAAGGEPAYYRLYLETHGTPEECAHAAAAVDARLMQSHPYLYCRRMNQLGPVRTLRVRGAHRAFQVAMTSTGKKAGDIKPTALALPGPWEAVFLREAGDGTA